MRLLALISALAFAAPAAAQSVALPLAFNQLLGTEPRARCASCSFIAAGSSAQNLSVQSSVIAGGDSGSARGQIVLRDNPAPAASQFAIYIDRELSATRYAICLSGATNGTCLNAITVDGSTAATFSSSIVATGFTASGAAGISLTGTNGRITWTSAGRYLDMNEATGNLQLVSAGLALTTNTAVATLASSVGTAASGTGITATYSGALRQWVHRVNVTNAALAAAGTSDITLHLTPVNSKINRVLAEVKTVVSGGALSAVTVVCGNTAGGNQYLLSGSVLSAQTTLGDVVGEMGAGVVSATLADMGTVASGVPGAITVQCRFTCTGANCSVATQGNIDFIVEGTTY